MIRARWGCVAVVVMGVLIVAGTVLVAYGMRDVDKERELTLLSLAMSHELGSPVVRGEAWNDTDVSLGSLEAKVKWYGEDLVVLGTSSDFFACRLEPGEAWSFEVHGDEVCATDVVRYKLRVTGRE